MKVAQKMSSKSEFSKPRNEIMSALPAIAACVLVACSSDGGGGRDTTTDQQVDMTESSENTSADDTSAEFECFEDVDCDDSDPCTVDICSSDDFVCSHDPVDADGDGFFAMEARETECVGGTDCDDTDASVFPGSTIAGCTPADRDCNGKPDDDNDGDGQKWIGCGGTDCDDADDAIHSGSTEIACTTEDHDCNGHADRDNDSDGYTRIGCDDGLDCNDADDMVNPGNAELPCDGKDNNCDCLMSPTEDADSDGYANVICVASGLQADCNDEDCTIHPLAAEACDKADQDCDGTWADGNADDDEDGYLDILCGGDDCDDSNATLSPGSLDLCTGGIDEDCDGFIDCRPGAECTAFGGCAPIVDYVIIAAGTFTMGSPDSEPGRKSDEPLHQVTLTHSFEIQATEVTQRQFFAMMGYQPGCNMTCGDDCPVECLDWHEAAAYCNALSLSFGYEQCYTCTGSMDGVTCEPSAIFASPYDCPGYRLPTEAEWEYSATAGRSEGTYNGTSTLTHCENPNTVLDPIAWFCGNAGSQRHRVGTAIANPWLLYDMLGNVQEWCHDWYGAYTGDVSDPWGPVSGEGRVIRGGAWNATAAAARTSSRNFGDPFNSVAVSLGFRIVRTLP